jgi:isoquinoline 1-oxidoreductase beta subunit
MAEDPHALKRKGPSRRTLLIGGGAGLGLLVAWAVWPRTYLPNLNVEPGETLFWAWLKIGSDGHISVAVPQAELGQGVFTAFPQIIADELGADWKRVGVEPAPLNPLYANPLGASELFEVALGSLSQSLQRTHAARTALVLTAGSSSIRNFESDLRQAGAAARVMLCKAAARRWGVDWQACGTAEGWIVHGNQRLHFGDVAAEAADETLPDTLPLRTGPNENGANRLYGQSVPRLDVPSKVDGSANYAADIRLPGMVFASVRQGPSGQTQLVKVDEEAGKKVPGVVAVVTTDQWVAAVADNWWAADRALGVMHPRFKIPPQLVNSDTIDEALTKAFDGDGERIASTGDLEVAFKGAKVVNAEYRVGVALHATIEPMTATAAYDNGRLSLWMPTQAPGLARTAAARAAGLSEDSVTVHSMMAGGSFGAKLEFQVAEQAAIIAKRIGKPVQLTWNRGEDFRHDRYRAAAAGRMTARLGDKSGIGGWLAKIAAPQTGRELSRRLMGSDPVVMATLALPGGGDPTAVKGAIPPYAIPNVAVDHHSADIGLMTGHWRSDAHSYTAFFTESFIDELAHVAGVEAVSFRMAMLGNEPRLARCLQTAAQLGNWQGGIAGSGQGIACHMFHGSYIAVMAEAHLVGRKVKVDRLVAAVDVGRVVNPDLLTQQIEGGLIFGMAAAIGCSTSFTDNAADVKALDELGLPTLAESPDITVEIIRSESDPGGVGELGVPAVAPAIANALQAASGVRFRVLPLLSDVE